MTKWFLNAMSTNTPQSALGRDYCSFILCPSLLRQTGGCGLGLHKLRRIRPAPYLTVWTPAQSHITALNQRLCISSSPWWWAWLPSRWWNKTDPFGLCRSLKIPMVSKRLLPVSWKPLLSDLCPICATILSWRWWLNQKCWVLCGLKSSGIPFPEPVQPGQLYSRDLNAQQI